MLDLDENDLDFTRGTPFDDVLPQPQPQPAPALLSEVEVGVNALGTSGFHVTITQREAPRRKDRGPRTILIIDDDESVRLVLEHYLGEAGYSTRLAGNREQILLALKTPPLPDVILLDVEMPDADGFELLEKFQQSKIVGKIPVVMLTARCNRRDVTRGLTLGAAGYITKPAKLTAINEAVRALLG
jgi:two-component system OmpR family response regulator